MRKMLFATAAVLGLAAGAANAQTTRPQAMGESSPEYYLQAAQDALARRQRMVARDALEHAETRLLDRSVNPSMARQADTSPRVQQIAEARRAIDRGDMTTARQLISQAMSNNTAAGGGMGGGTMAPGNPGEGGSNIGGMTAGGTSPSAAGSGTLGAGSMGPGSMGSRSPAMTGPAMMGTDVPGQAGPMNQGTGMDSQMPLRR
jgi:hypothetical protein